MSRRGLADFAAGFADALAPRIAEMGMEKREEEKRKRRLQELQSGYMATYPDLDPEQALGLAQRAAGGVPVSAQELDQLLNEDLLNELLTSSGWSASELEKLPYNTKQRMADELSTYGVQEIQRRELEAELGRLQGKYDNAPIERWTDPTDQRKALSILSRTVQSPSADLLEFIVRGRWPTAGGVAKDGLELAEVDSLFNLVETYGQDNLINPITQEERYAQTQLKAILDVDSVDDLKDWFGYVDPVEIWETASSQIHATGVNTIPPLQQNFTSLPRLYDEYQQLVGFGGELTEEQIKKLEKDPVYKWKVQTFKWFDEYAEKGSTDLRISTEAIRERAKDLHDQTREVAVTLNRGPFKGKSSEEVLLDSKPLIQALSNWAQEYRDAAIRREMTPEEALSEGAKKFQREELNSRYFPNTPLSDEDMDVIWQWLENIWMEPRAFEERAKRFQRMILKGVEGLHWR